MRTSVAIVADDLTGAADTGVGFARAGLTTTVTWAEAAPAGSLDAEVVAIDTGTRGSPQSVARAATARVVAGLCAAGVATLYKKIDSTLRGHVGTEVAAALNSWHHGSVALVAPAFPAAGRTTVDGHVLVGATRLDNAYIPRLFEAAGLAAEHVDLACVRDTRALEERLRTAHATGTRVYVCDAQTDADLASIARAGAGFGPGVVWVGSGGLAAVLPAALGLRSPLSPPGTPTQPTAPARPTAPTTPTTALEPNAWADVRSVSGPILVAAGSAHAVTRTQIAELVAGGSVHLPVPTGVLANDDGDCRELGESLLRHLRRGTDVIVSLVGHDPTSSGPASVDPEGGDPALAVRLGEFLRPCAGHVGGLVATGGDTATAVLRAWGTTALRLVGEVEPGVPLSVSVAPRPVPVVTKAGGFGSSRTLAIARARLEEAVRRPPGSAEGAR